MNDDPTKQWDPFADDPSQMDESDPLHGVEPSERFKDPLPAWIDPTADPRAAKWVEHSFEWYKVKIGTWARNNCYELARLFVPLDFVGILSLLEVSVEADLPDVPTLQVNNSWMYPHYYDYMDPAFASDPLTKALRFHLRIQSKQDLPNHPQQTSSLNTLPGLPIDQLAPWTDTRYDYSRNSKSKIKLLLPQEHWVRLFVEILSPEPNEWIIMLWGRLGGVMQSFQNNEYARESTRVYHP